MRIREWKIQVIPELFVFTMHVFSEPHCKLKVNCTQTTSQDGLGSVNFKKGLRSFGMFTQAKNQAKHAQTPEKVQV